jgi:uncharacterized protein YxjI
MPIVATCECGASYTLKDEFAGQALRCPACQRTFQAPTSEAAIPIAALAVAPQADPLFDRDKFLLRQKVMAINQKYFVSDEQNRPIVFVERPAHVAMSALALVAAILVFIIVMGLTVFIVGAILGTADAGFAAGVIAGIVLGVVAAVAVAMAIVPKRHVHFYRDETRGEQLLDILQDKKLQLITATYTLRDSAGQVLARFRKNFLYNLFRKRWHCLAPDGTVICLAMEDSFILSLLRRFLGPMLGLLRTNFIFVTPGDDPRIMGEFNRKLTLFDRYVLDLTQDPTRALDRRIALALGVMLDTGERR